MRWRPRPVTASTPSSTPSGPTCRTSPSSSSPGTDGSPWSTRSPSTPHRSPASSPGPVSRSPTRRGRTSTCSPPRAAPRRRTSSTPRSRRASSGCRHPPCRASSNPCSMWRCPRPTACRTGSTAPCRSASWSTPSAMSPTSWSCAPSSRSGSRRWAGSSGPATSATRYWPTAPPAGTPMRRGGGSATSAACRSAPWGGAGGGGVARAHGGRLRPASADRAVRPRAAGHLAAPAAQRRGAATHAAASTGGTWPRAGRPRSSRPFAAGSSSRRSASACPARVAKRPASSAALAVCSGLVRQIADDLDFDQALLATRADVAKLLCGEPGRLDSGWRRRDRGRRVAAPRVGPGRGGPHPERHPRARGALRSPGLIRPPASRTRRCRRRVPGGVTPRAGRWPGSPSPPCPRGRWPGCRL